MATNRFAEHGIKTGKVSLDLAAMLARKDKVVEALTENVRKLLEGNDIEIVTGTGTVTEPGLVTVQAGRKKPVTLAAKNILLATGSESIEVKGLEFDGKYIVSSTEALSFDSVPKSLGIVGGGYIGCELGSVYSALGSKVTVVELTPHLMPGTDPDLVRPLQRRIAKRYEAIHLETRVAAINVADEALVARLEGKHEATEHFDRVLVAVGRTPNGGKIAADKAGVNVDDKGFIAVDRHMRTNVDHIFAIGDVVGQPMLAHKATHEGKVAAEVCAGEKSAFDARVIPSVAYTDPEVAWVGLTEAEAKASEIGYEVGKFPWAASGRALGNDRSEGFTKLLFDNSTRRIIGAGIVGPMAGDLIAECALAIEMGAEAADIGLTIHPHPTLSETVAMAAEAFEGTITDLYLPRKR